MDIISTDLACEPVLWHVVFNRKTESWWARFVPGRFKHVRAYAYVPGLHVWIFYDVGVEGAAIQVAAPGAPANAIIASWIADAEIVTVMRRPPHKGRIPFGQWCAPAVGHLLRLRPRFPGATLLPDTLHAECLANGGTPFEMPHARRNAKPAATNDR
jgi:hypothetical protein